MPRRKTDRMWEQKIFALKALEPQLSAEAMARRFADESRGRGYWPAARTIRRILDEEWPKVTPEERRQYAYFRWPESMEDGSLPWEASSACLELLRLLNQRPQETTQRPPIRLVKWFWRVTQAAPNARDRIRYDLATQLALDEVLGIAKNMRTVEWYLAFQPWHSEEDRDTYEEAQRRTSGEPIIPFEGPKIQTVPGEHEGDMLEQALDMLHPGHGRSMLRLFSPISASHVRLGDEWVEVGRDWPDYTRLPKERDFPDAELPSDIEHRATEYRKAKGNVQWQWTFQDDDDWVLQVQTAVSQYAERETPISENEAKALKTIHSIVPNMPSLTAWFFCLEIVHGPKGEDLQHIFNSLGFARLVSTKEGPTLEAIEAHVASHVRRWPDRPLVAWAPNSDVVTSYSKFVDRYLVRGLLGGARITQTPPGDTQYVWLFIVKQADLIRSPSGGFTVKKGDTKREDTSADGARTGPGGEPRPG